MNSEKQHWLDKPRNIRNLYRALWVVCLALLGADLLYHKHVHFSAEGWIGFYLLFGFFSYVFIVNAAKLLRKVISRREDYYDQ